MIDLLELHKQFILSHLRLGDVAVDYTMGNGHDTEFLSRTVGEEGKVYAFDLQEEAVESTRKRLEASDAPKNYTLICASHHRVKEFVTEKVKAGMFNLGYLPGSDRTVTTLCETTIPAVSSAIELMAQDGVLLVAVYPGHAEGKKEGELLSEMLEKLPKKQYTVTKIRLINSPDSPYFFAIESK